MIQNNHRKNVAGDAYEIVIVGSGITGNTITALLQDAGRRILQISTAEIAADEKAPGRVVALNKASENILRHLEVWDMIDDKVKQPYNRMEIWDSESSAALCFSASSVKQNELGHIIANQSISRTLETKIQPQIHRHARVLASTRQRGYMELKLDDGGLVRSKLVIAADGGRSNIRENHGLKSRVRDFHQRAIIATVQCTRSHKKTAWQRFLPSGPLAFLPLDKNRCSIVWSCDNDQAHVLMEMDDTGFIAQLTGAMEGRFGELSMASGRADFPLLSRHANRYISPHLVLLGDAAHQVHPLAGQGANLALADAAALAQCLLESPNTDASQHRALRRFERWRYGENQLMMVMQHGIKDIFADRRSRWRLARSVGVGLLGNSDTLKRILIKRAMGLTGDTPIICQSAV